MRSLPDERKALAERYTIDADEAERRERQAAEQAARRAEAEGAERQRHSESISQPPQQPQLVLAPVEGSPAASEIAQGDEREQNDLPIYRWFGGD